MKHEQVVVDYWKMFKTSALFLLLACSGYVLIKMVQTVFWLPRYLEKNQQRLEELAKTYSLNLKDKCSEDQNNKIVEEETQVVEAAEEVEPKKEK